MKQPNTPILRDIVLVGGGHTHVGVLRNFAMNKMPGVRLTVICRDTHTPYSGMLPGYVAGHYQYDDVHIDLRRLAEFADARFFRSEVVGLDRHTHQVLCSDRPAETGFSFRPRPIRRLVQAREGGSAGPSLHRRVCRHPLGYPGIGDGREERPGNQLLRCSGQRKRPVSKPRRARCLVARPLTRSRQRRNEPGLSSRRMI